MPKLTVNGIEVEVEDGATVLHACEEAGVEIPRFCYHDRLSIAGNCRMCLVDMERAPKPVASCAMPAGEGMVVRTDTDRVEKARKGVMEFLLINHPLDCPICDQGGECDLQDQAMGYGFDHSRYEENKRAVEDKHMGPLISTTMTRCIHCTRCVRFATEVAGVPELGAIGRGESMEITTYLEKTLASELSANVIDLCPVGALTSKPYAFTARPWELNKTESIDVMDAVGSNIRVDARGAQVLRVLPRLNEDINEEWISDKTRYAIDGLRRQRLDRPYVRGRDGKLAPASWDEAFSLIATRMKKAKPNAIAAITGDQCDAEAMFALKTLFDKLGSASIDCRQDGAKIGGARAGYLFNSTIAGIDEADALLIIGSNPRIEAAVLNARIRRNWLATRLPVGVVGPQTDLTYDALNLGEDPAVLADILSGKSKFAAKLKRAKRPMIIIGMGALARADGAAILGQAREIAETYGVVDGDWNGFNVLHTGGGAGGWPRSWPDAGAWRPRCRRYLPGGGSRKARSCVASGRRRDRRGEACQHLHRLSGTSWRPRRPRRRRGSSRCRLHRKGRHLRQYRGPCAICRPRDLPAGRGPRGLDHHPCACRTAWRQSRLRQHRRAPRGDVRGGAAFRRPGPDQEGPLGEVRRPRQDRGHADDDSAGQFPHDLCRQPCLRNHGPVPDGASGRQRTRRGGVTAWT